MGVVRHVVGLPARMPSRARYSFADQAMISGVNALVGIILVRFLGLHAFGVFSMALIGILFLAIPQGALILGPMMSLYDQRGSISRSSYLAALLAHQALYAALAVAIVFLAAIVVGSDAGIDFALVACVVVATQFQDLARRFFFVTERPRHALVSDAIAYGGRLVGVAVLAFMGNLTIDLVWVVMAVAGAAALLPWVSDLANLDFARQPIREVTNAHKNSARWLLGSSLLSVLAENNFVMLIIGGVLGAAQLGAVRAVQTVALALNLVNLSLENFVPSAASQRLMQGGKSALLRYVRRVALLGASAIGAVVLVLVVFADPIMQVLYGQTFENQAVLIMAFGAYNALTFVAFVITAGLRALDAVASTFVPQAILSAASLFIALYAVGNLGIVGTLFALLGMRLVFTMQLAMALRRKITA